MDNRERKPFEDKLVDLFGPPTVNFGLIRIVSQANLSEDDGKSIAKFFQRENMCEVCTFYTHRKHDVNE